MGLDMYAYAATRSGQQQEFWEGADIDPDTGEFTNPRASKPQEIAYWRKHPCLHGWMAQLYRARGGLGNFNGDEVELTWDDLEQLEDAIKSGGLPLTEGFFFGEDESEYYRESDLKFIREARSYLFLGLRVFYNSSW